MFTKTNLFTLSLITIVVLSGCASIIHGPTQKVDFSSQPAGAKITIDNIGYGFTPQSVPLRRKGRFKGQESGKKEYAVKIELDGYYPYEVKLKREMDGWFIGNIVFGGLIGIIIDASNGSMYKLNPNQVIAQPSRIATAKNDSGDNIYIAVTLHPDPTWEKIGMMERSITTK